MVCSGISGAWADDGDFGSEAGDLSEKISSNSQITAGPTPVPGKEICKCPLPRDLKEQDLRYFENNCRHESCTNKTECERRGCVYQASAGAPPSILGCKWVTRVKCGCEHIKKEQLNGVIPGVDSTPKCESDEEDSGECGEQLCKSDGFPPNSPNLCPDPSNRGKYIACNGAASVNRPHAVKCQDKS